MAIEIAYVVITADAEELAAARAAGTEILFEGDVLGVSRFFESQARGLTYAVLPLAPPDLRERARTALVQCEGLVSQVESTMLSVRALFPVSLENQAMLEGDQDYDFEMDLTTTLEQCLYDLLPPLKRELRRLAHSRQET